MKYIIPDFIRHQLSIKETSGVFSAQVIFVDISGFTNLTENLMKHGAEGAEILSNILLTIFNPLVEIVCSQGGIIPHFVGDAFVAIFENILPESTLQICKQLEDSANLNNTFDTRFGTFKIHIHGGVSCGNIHWGITGNVLKSFYFRGEGIERAASALNNALPDEFIFDKYFSRFASLSVSPSVNLPTNSLTHQPTNRIDVLAENFFYPSSVTEYRGIGEFRDVVSVFIAFTGSERFDFMNRFTIIVREQFENFGGYLKEFDFSDKGDLAVGFFGAPISFENNAPRALECVLTIKHAVHLEFPQQQLRMGITRGTTFAGKIGGTQRYQYALVGSRVNLAARLAVSAPSGEIVVDEIIAQTAGFEFENSGSIRYKGFSKEMPTYRFLRKKNSEDNARTSTGGENLSKNVLQRHASNVMMGRDAELKQLLDFVKNKLDKGTNGWIYIWGEAGIGKSRLIYELKQSVKDIELKIDNDTGFNSHLTQSKSKLLWVHCPCDEILRKPFNPLIRFLKNYFGQSPEATPEQNLRHFERIFESLIRQLPEQAHLEGAELIRTKSILSALPGVYYPDSLWQHLDAKGRNDNTLTALTEFFSALSYIQPVILEIEDAHWLDESTTGFLKLLAKKITGKPVIVFQSCRYDDEGRKSPNSYQLSAISHQQTELIADSLKLIAKNTILEIDLDVWQRAVLNDFATARLGNKVHPELTDTLWRTTNGNPFYAEQVLDYFQENNLLSLINEGWIITDKNIKISNSLQAILTARIDRLSVILKETVKAAAVIGREFEVPILSEVLSHQEDYIERNGNKHKVLREQIDIAEKGQIWRAMSELRYIFKHTLLREAAYDMQLRTRLRELHFAIAKSIEKIYADTISERYIDLAFHYEQAEVLPKMREYFGKAADYAGYNFQNQQAIDFYDRLLKYETDNNERVIILIKKGQVLQLIGKWQESEICFHEALFKSALSGDIVLKGRANSALGVLLMLKGEYEKSRTFLEKSAGYFERVADTKGILNTYGHLGNLFFRQGDYQNAENYFSRCIDLGEQENDSIPPLIVSNLGLTYMNQGFYEKGIACQSEALKKSEAAKDKIGQAILNVNIGIVWSEKGDIDSALPYFENGLVLAEFLGNKQLISIALGCLGNVWRLKNDFTKSLEYLEKDKTMCVELGDKQGLSIVHELLGRWYLSQNFAEKAFWEFEMSLTLCRQLNYRKGISKAFLGIGEAQTQLNEFDNALKSFQKAGDEADAINNQLIKGNTLIAKSILFRKFNRTDLFEHLLGLLKPIAEKLGNEPLTKQMWEFEKVI